RPFPNPDGTLTAITPLPAETIAKLDGVTAVTPLTLTPPPDLLDGAAPDPTALANRIAAMQTLPHNNRAIPADVRAPQDWYDTPEIHHANDAWANGYTGQGVKVLINDSGIDFCHPDLIGTWATVDDPASPYDGWPLMFDSYSLYLYALDQRFGQTNIADGLSDYADTSATCTAATCTYQPIGAAAPHTYTLPSAIASQSGIYHIGSHPDTQLENIYGQRVAVLVVDAAQPGHYDTVFVDLDNDDDFSDEEPATQDMPIACLDNWDSINQQAGSDGYNDLSGGLIYFIADGATPIPASDWLWGGFTPANGDLVAFTLVDVRETTHGEYVASNVAAQGIVNGPNSNGVGENELPAWKPPYAGPGTGMVLGTGRDAKLVANGNYYDSPFYEDGFLFAALGYDGLPGTADDSQIINNSWAEFALHNDGWDVQSRYFEQIAQINPTLTILFGTSNSGPGYGSLAAPAPASAMQVGASTLFGSTTTFDSITGTLQIEGGDVIPFSSRGPDTRGGNGVGVVATGSAATGLRPINQYADGWVSWGAWQGVSRSAPVVAGILALVYDAYYQAHGVWPDTLTAQAILQAGAQDLHYDPLTQGAGLTDALQATTIAGGDGGFYVRPSQWQPGSAPNIPAFTHVVYAGEAATQPFTVTNSGPAPLTLTFASDQLQQMAPAITLPFTTSLYTQEEPLNNARLRHTPDYLIDITSLIPAGTDLLEVNVIFPFSQYDPNGNYVEDSRWSLQLLNWTDINGDGNLWTDDNASGTVNDGEIDLYEYNRFTYDDNRGTALQGRIQQPLVRMADGIFIDLRHTKRSALVPTTSFQIELVAYQHAAWDWLQLPMTMTVAAGETAVFTPTLLVPQTAVPGTVNGALRVSGGGQNSLIPITAQVAARLADGAITLGGTPPAATPLDNGRVRGNIDWGWAVDAGDWRFFYLDGAGVSPAASLIVRSQWAGPAPYTDIDTRIYAPVVDVPAAQNPAHFGPYTLDYAGGSAYLPRGGGKFTFNTVTGGAEEWVAAPLGDGLHLLANQTVLYEGADFAVPFTQTVGTAVLTPTPLIIQTCETSGTIPLTLTTTIDLPNLSGAAFGVYTPTLLAGQQVAQDAPWDASSASFTHTLTLSNTGSLTIDLHGQPGDDLNLYLLFDENGDETFDWNTEVVAASTSFYADETVSLSLPAAGDYLIAVHGNRLMGDTAVFDLTIHAAQGTALSLTGIPTGTISAGTLPLTLGWDHTTPPGTLEYDQLILGPDFAPAALHATVYLLPCDGTGILPAASFTHVPVTAVNAAIPFTNTSTGLNLSYLWDFGDGNTSTEANPTHQFAAPGTFTVTLTVSNELGGDTAVSTLEVRAMVYLPVVIRP
ncbi:MAG: PKD domain-containing protein, partial [Anaerolineales bacterium]|nr:PKD domain-containing protein [Anaerolineales bacterium]